MPIRTGEETLSYVSLLHLLSERGMKNRKWMVIIAVQIMAGGNVILFIDVHQMLFIDRSIEKPDAALFAEFSITV